MAYPISGPFLDELVSKLEFFFCDYCRDPLHHSYLIPECNHYVCAQCTKKAIAQGTCPKCDNRLINPPKRAIYMDKIVEALYEIRNHINPSLEANRTCSSVGKRKLFGRECSLGASKTKLPSSNHREKLNARRAKSGRGTLDNFVRSHSSPRSTTKKKVSSTCKDNSVSKVIRSSPGFPILKSLDQTKATPRRQKRCVSLDQKPGDSSALYRDSPKDVLTFPSADENINVDVSLSKASDSAFIRSATEVETAEAAVQRNLASQFVFSSKVPSQSGNHCEEYVASAQSNNQILTQEIHVGYLDSGGPLAKSSLASDSGINSTIVVNPKSMPVLSFVHNTLDRDYSVVAKDVELLDAFRPAQCCTCQCHTKDIFLEQRDSKDNRHYGVQVELDSVLKLDVSTSTPRLAYTHKEVQICPIVQDCASGPDIGENNAKDVTSAVSVAVQTDPPYVAPVKLYRNVAIQSVVLASSALGNQAFNNTENSLPAADTGQCRQRMSSHDYEFDDNLLVSIDAAAAKKQPVTSTQYDGQEPLRKSGGSPSAGSAVKATIPESFTLDLFSPNTLTTQSTKDAATEVSESLEGKQEKHQQNKIEENEQQGQSSVLKGREHLDDHQDERNTLALMFRCSDDFSIPETAPAIGSPRKPSPNRPPRSINANTIQKGLVNANNVSGANKQIGINSSEESQLSLPARKCALEISDDESDSIMAHITTQSNKVAMSKDRGKKIIPRKKHLNQKASSIKHRPKTTSLVLSSDDDELSVSTGVNDTRIFKPIVRDRGARTLGDDDEPLPMDTEDMKILEREIENLDREIDDSRNIGSFQ